jgi:transcription initiation factor TFIID subunit 7
MAASRPGSNTTTAGARPALKKIRMKPPPGKGNTTPATPFSGIKFTAKGEAVPHAPGDAYDSEASDKEEDPVRETVVILRTMGGPSTEYLHREIEAGNIGKPKDQGGADVAIQFIDARERRALVSVNGLRFAAVLVDLPTITEAMKTWDRKSMMKNSDICQMLLCFAQVNSEAEARAAPLPAVVQKGGGLKWPHGLTPPMHDAVNRRFRKAPTEDDYIKNMRTVKKLLADDLGAEETSYEWVQDEGDASEYGDTDADAEGEEDDYFGPQATEQEAEPDIDIDEAGLEAMMEEDEEDEEMVDTQTPGTQMEAPTPMTTGVQTPAAAPAREESDAGEDDGDGEEVVSDEDDDDDDEDLDDEEQAEQAEKRAIIQEIKELQARLAKEEADLAGIANLILRKRKQAAIQSLKAEIDLRQAGLEKKNDG